VGNNNVEVYINLIKSLLMRSVAAAADVGRKLMLDCWASSVIQRSLLMILNSLI